jgi:kynurenine formamidase
MTPHQQTANQIPKFDELPVKQGAPPESSWGVFGDDDGIGCLNFLTSEGVVEAARLIQTGKVFRLDAKLDFAKPTLLGRASLEHNIVPLGPFANDDILDRLNTQSSTQWDGLGHVGHGRYERFYNDVTVADVREGGNRKLGIHRWADRVVGRGVLIDAFAFRKSQGRPVSPLTKDVYTLEELQACLDAQGVALKPGTILLVRTGWMEEYEKSTAEEKAAMAPFDKIQSAGVEASRRMAAWLWDHRVAAIAADCPAVEALPMELGDDNLLHYRALPLLGLPLGELFILAPLAEDCARDRRYEFMIVSAPLHVEGGIASPPNAVAIK